MVFEYTRVYDRFIEALKEECGKLEDGANVRLIAKYNGISYPRAKLTMAFQKEHATGPKIVIYGELIEFENEELDKYIRLWKAKLCPFGDLIIDQMALLQRINVEYISEKFIRPFINDLCGMYKPASKETK